MSEEEGYDEDWVEPNKVAEIGPCPICCAVPREAVAHECGQLFCASCWQQVERRSVTATTQMRCPTCRQAGSCHPAHRDRRTILNFEIRCPRQCPAVVRLGDREAHLSNSCLHRLVACELCQLQISHAQLEQHLASACSMRPTPCPDCEQRVAADQLAQHRTDSCPFRSSPCPVCGDVIRLNDLDAHLLQAPAKHFLTLLRKYDELQAEVVKLRQLTASHSSASTAPLLPAATSSPHSSFLTFPTPSPAPSFSSLSSSAASASASLSSSLSSALSSALSSSTATSTTTMTPPTRRSSYYGSSSHSPSSRYNQLSTASSAPGSPSPSPSPSPSSSSVSVAGGLHKERYHPGFIGAAPNGITRSDRAQIKWASKVNETQEGGYTWWDYNVGWESPLERVYRSDSNNQCRWTCCGGMWDSSGCSVLTLFPHPGSFSGCGGNPSGVAHCRGAGNCGPRCSNCGARTHWNCCTSADAASKFCLPGISLDQARRNYSLCYAESPGPRSLSAIRGYVIPPK